MHAVVSSALACALLWACASTEESDAGDGLQVDVVSQETGYRLNQERSGRLVLQVSELDGSVHALVWDWLAETNGPSIQQLTTCLGNLDSTIRYGFGAPASGAPRLGDAVGRCVAASGLPPPRDDPQDDARAYLVEIVTRGPVTLRSAPNRNPLGRSGASQLGAVWTVDRGGMSRLALVSDAKRCLSGGVKEVGAGWSTAGTPSRDGITPAHGAASMHPLVSWFDDCLRGHGYHAALHASRGL
jgi:hypothetical protein